MTKYALFKYSTENIGDEIQSIAAKRFLPRVDYYIDRDYINDFVPETDDEIKLIMNGWYTHRPEDFPVKSKYINPLMISVYFDDRIKGHFTKEENVDWFKRFQPIGTRNPGEVEFFTKLGIESYFSGCMTLTLNRDERVKKQDYILALDVPNEIYDKMISITKYPVIRLSAGCKNRWNTIEQNFRIAKYYLYLYQSARLVVTTRLHGTLPCLALGTDVLNIENPGFEASRYEGLRELSNHMTIDEFLRDGYDINNPLRNPEKYIVIRKRLEERCSEYTGFISSNSYLEGEMLESFFSSPELIQAMTRGFSAGKMLWGNLH